MTPLRGLLILPLVAFTVSTFTGVWSEATFDSTAWALLPPLIAIGLTFLIRNVYVALVTAIVMGGWLLEPANALTVLLTAFDTHIVEAIAPADGNPGHAKIIAFTLLMGAFVELTREVGITGRLVAVFSRICRTRRSGQLGIASSGLVLFFDDYANSLLLGTSFRNVADQLRISKAKFAFLIDATAAPVAGVALVSTWIGVELSYYAESLRATGYEGPVYWLFLQTIPYRFYPLGMLAFVFMLSYQNRDFGPMLAAERHAIHNSEINSDIKPDAGPLAERAVQQPALAKPEPHGRLWIDLAPFAALLLALLSGIAFSGWSALAEQSERPDISLQALFDNCDPNDAVLWASIAGVMATMALGRWRTGLGWSQLTDASIEGMKSMLPAIVIIVLAWSLSSLCDTDHLDVAGFLFSWLGQDLNPIWLPTISFVLCGLISFSTGSSFATMGIMFPILVPLTVATLERSQLAAGPESTILAAVVGNILAGAIWGDHCSPISDTTVLTSAATGCDHVEHVHTQMPYALTVGAISILCGTIPIGLGVSVWIVWPLALTVTWLTIRFLGRSAQ